MEIDVSFQGKGEWDDWVRQNREAFDPANIALAARDCMMCGVQSSFLGSIPGNEIAAESENYREDLLARGFNSRQRAILDLIHDEFGAPQYRLSRIHLHEAVTRFARAIQGRFPFVLASEFLPDKQSQQDYFPVPHVDICASNIPNAVFDLIVSQEVLEHVPSIDAALYDMARILKPGARLLATVPLLQDREKGTRMAGMKLSGEIEHFTAPVYHGNPVDRSGGALVFEMPGWDILARARSAGFTEAAVRFIGSGARGILSKSMFGVFVIDARR